MTSARELIIFLLFWTWIFAGHETQRGEKLQQEHLYGVDFEGGSLLHLAVDSGVLKVKL